MLQNILIGALVLLACIGLNWWHDCVWTKYWNIFVGLWAICPLAVDFIGRKYHEGLILFTAMVSLSLLAAFNDILDFVGICCFVGYCSEFYERTPGLQEHVLRWGDHVLFHVFGLVFAAVIVAIPVLTTWKAVRYPETLAAYVASRAGARKG